MRVCVCVCVCVCVDVTVCEHVHLCARMHVLGGHTNDCVCMCVCVYVVCVCVLCVCVVCVCMYVCVWCVCVCVCCVCVCVTLCVCVRYSVCVGLVQMQSGGMQQLLSNPEAIEAALQIQQGMMRLQNTAPGMMGQGSVSSLVCVCHVVRNSCCVQFLLFHQMA